MLFNSSSFNNNNNKNSDHKTEPSMSLHQLQQLILSNQQNSATRMPIPPHDQITFESFNNMTQKMNGNQLGMPPSAIFEALHSAAMFHYFQQQQQHQQINGKTVNINNNNCNNTSLSSPLSSSSSCDPSSSSSSSSFSSSSGSSISSISSSSIDRSCSNMIRRKHNNNENDDGDEQCYLKKTNFNEQELIDTIGLETSDKSHNSLNFSMDTILAKGTKRLQTHNDNDCVKRKCSPNFSQQNIMDDKRAVSNYLIQQNHKQLLHNQSMNLNFIASSMPFNLNQQAGTTNIDDKNRNKMMLNGTNPFKYPTAANIFPFDPQQQQQQQKQQNDSNFGMNSNLFQTSTI
jgi:hypothetical protein